MGPQRILIVDDDNGFARVLVNWLERSGFRVLVVGDGAAALEVVACQQSDLLVLKLRLPDRDGIEVTRTIRSNPLVADLPIMSPPRFGGQRDKVVNLT